MGPSCKSDAIEHAYISTNFSHYQLIKITKIVNVLSSDSSLSAVSKRISNEMLICQHAFEVYAMILVAFLEFRNVSLFPENVYLGTIT